MANLERRESRDKLALKDREGRWVPVERAGPPGLPGDVTELDIFPELRLDYTVDKACADSIRANYEFGRHDGGNRTAAPSP